jgi:hypothetical protein
MRRTAAAVAIPKDAAAEEQALKELARELNILLTGETVLTLSSAPEGIHVLRDFSVFPPLGVKDHRAPAVAACCAAKGRASTPPMLVHHSAAIRLHFSTL